MIGTIVKTISNQFEVYADGKTYSCIAMGKLRKGVRPIIGDIVDFEKFEYAYGIQKVHKRKNELKRPIVANVDQAIIVMSAKDPDFSTVLVDRLIFLVAYANITPILCITKMDLINKDDKIHSFIKDYKDSGYEVYSSGNGIDTHELEDMIHGKISVLTGQSGAGKSSLLNRLDSKLQIKTQEISKALGRGKHTTRNSELYELFGGWIADTPGFSSLNFDELDALTFSRCIPDFVPYIDECKFKDCVHMEEPGCRITELVKQGSIVSYRYDHYKEIMEHIRNVKPKY